MKHVWSIRRAIRLLEAVHLHSSGGDMGLHNLLFPMRLSSLHTELRAKVKAELKDPAEELRWRQSEAEFEGPQAWAQQDEISVFYHVDEDMGEAREVTRRTTTVLNMYVPANGVSWLVSHDLDPGKSDLYLRLENGALVKISWWETIPAPLPGSTEAIHLEVHGRCWPQRPITVIRPIATAQCVECEFYALHSAIPLVIWLPVLEGGWVVPSHYRDILAQNGLREDATTLIVYGEPRRTNALKPTTLSQPVAINPALARAPILVWLSNSANTPASMPSSASQSPPPATKAQPRAHKQKGKGAKEKSEGKEVETEAKEKEKETKGVETRSKEKEGKGKKGKGEKTKAVTPPAPTRVQPARKKRNPQYGGARDDKAADPAAAAADLATTASPGAVSSASQAGTKQDKQGDVDAPRAHSPSYADVVRASSPSRLTDGGSPFSAGPPGNPSSSARGTTLTPTNERLVLGHAAVPQPLRNIQGRGAQATPRHRGVDSNGPSPNSPSLSPESSGASQSSFEPDASSSSFEPEAPPPPPPTQRVASKRARGTSPPPTAPPPAKKAREGLQSHKPIAGSTPTRAQATAKRPRSPSAQDIAPPRKKNKKDMVKGQSKGTGTKSLQDNEKGKGDKGTGKGEGQGQQRPKPKPPVKAKESEGKGVGVEERGKGTKSKGGSGKGVDAAGSKANAGMAWMDNGGDYIAPVTPPRPLQLIDFDPDDFVMPTPPPKSRSRKSEANAYGCSH
ncbi:hypothetical protein FB107DRAFT_280035 [Schizophyllum commune]